jgi:hypothetical protein
MCPLFKGQKFEVINDHTTVDKEKFPIDSIWLDVAKRCYGRIVGYPLNDCYHDDYVGMSYFTTDGYFICFGASRTVNLAMSDIDFGVGFIPKREPKE